MSTVTSFFDGAKGLARNPLGVIALFVALVYGFATLLLGASGAHLRQEEQLPLVWFVVLFPVLVLGVFYRLVTKYPVNLYSPRDYRDDDIFKNLSQAQRKEQLNAEVKRAQAEVEPAATSTLPGVLTIAQEQAAPSSSASPPSLTSQAADELRAQIRDAKRLGLAKLEARSGLRLRTQVSFGDSGLATFDGLASSRDAVIVVEVKYLETPWVSERTVDDVLRRALAAEVELLKRNDQRKLKLIVVFVVGKDTGGGLARLHRVAESHFQKSPVAAEFQEYFLDALKREFKEESA